MSINVPKGQPDSRLADGSDLATEGQPYISEGMARRHRKSIPEFKGGWGGGGLAEEVSLLKQVGR